MLLEDEIKQQKFKSDYHKLAVNIIYTHGWLINKQTNIFKKFDITAAQFNILRILRGQHPNPVPVSLLKDRMLDKMSDASRLVERLRAKGLVDRKICSEDRRRVNVLITKKGLDLLTVLDGYESEFESFLKNLNVDEAIKTNRLLDKLRGNEK
ncbi:MAG: MarR family transcriptional regulator [Bacteroidetes bacterium]|nr:MarR family transcriptional regulator [Bacteroidota bacterium]MBU1116912.1 MarR family transcriptional regulator [Bacteroidota bacterium]MBU1798341.1 MarR family transcriptional regulator [Bacteroidota bacterium]